MHILSKSPTYIDFFKSYYYSNTYLPPVDLSDQGLAGHLLNNEDPATAKKAQDLLSQSKVRTILSEPLTYDFGEIKKRNDILTPYGFKLLSHKTRYIQYDPDSPLLYSEKTPFYSVLEHNELPNWIIKAGAARIPENTFMPGPQNDQHEMAIFTKEESLLRIEMANRIAKVAREANIDVIIPKKRLVAYNNLQGETDPTKKYCVLCEKINVLNPEETVDIIMKMDRDHQRDIAQKISKLVRMSGLVDASFDNIRLTPEGKLACIDTEPAGLLVAKNPDPNRNTRGTSVEKCARIGLFILVDQTEKADKGTLKLEPFLQEVSKEYKKSVSPKLSRWKITISVLSIGLLPLVVIIISVAKDVLAAHTMNKLNSMARAFIKRPVSERSPENEKKYMEQIAPIDKRFYSITDGVLY